MGIKDAVSRHVYMNPPARKYTNTPDNFPIEGKLDIEFPAEWHELHDELIKHDQITMNKKGSVSVLEVHHWNGCSKPTPFISDKIPIYESDGNCIGIIWLIIHGYTRKEISYILNISSCAVKCRLYSVFQKKSIFNIKQLRELYINNRMDSYIPSSILKNGLLFL